MSKRPYQHLPPLEHRPDGSPYRITPPQKRRASGLIRRECCNCEDGNCLALDDGDTCACPQMISFSVCCKWFRWAVLPLDRTLEAEIYRDRDLKRCAECGGVFVPKNGWADEYGRVYLYYPICEVVALLRCGRQKAVNTLRELQYAGLVEIQKQGCGKPNRIYPKSYEAVPNTDFKKSGYGTPEG